MRTQLDVFNYQNYRQFLEDYYQEQKIRQPDRFSHRYFAKHAGFKTSNFLQLLIKGKRNISHESLLQIADAIGVKGRKLEYLRILVDFNQADDERTKSTLYDKLVSFVEFQEARLVTESETVYFSKWYYPVVREMLKMKGFRPDPLWISKHIFPKISTDQAREAWSMLQSLKLIEQVNGRWIQKDSQLTTTKQKVRHDVIAYHKKMIQHGSESLSCSGTERDISGITMSISPTKFELIRRKIEEFRDEVQMIISKPLQSDQLDDFLKSQSVLKSRKDASEVNQVCQLNVQFFKLAES